MGLGHWYPKGCKVLGLIILNRKNKHDSIRRVLCKLDVKVLLTEPLKLMKQKSNCFCWMHMNSSNLFWQGGQQRQAAPAAWKREKKSFWSKVYEQISGELNRKISLISQIQQLQKLVQCEGNGLAWSGYALVLNFQSLFLQTEGQSGWTTNSLLLGIGYVLLHSHIMAGLEWGKWIIPEITKEYFCLYSSLYLA